MNTRRLYQRAEVCSNAPSHILLRKKEAFEELAAGSDAPFESRTRFLIFAASVGFRRDHWVENHDEGGEMRWNYISQNQRLSVIVSALTYAHTCDDDALLDAEKQIDVLTSFGARGARIINREVVNEPGANLDNLVSFLQKYRDAEESKGRMGVLEQIENEVSSLSSTE